MKSVFDNAYSEIMREYSLLRTEKQRERDQRREAAFAACPRLLEVSDRLAENNAARARARILKNTEALAELEKAHRSLLTEQTLLLNEAGIRREDLEIRYACPDCQDTGYIGQEKCHCLKEKLIRRLYEDSNLHALTESGGFDAIDYSLYDRTAPEGQASTYETMAEKIRICREFAENFDGHRDNLLFYGPTGTGKTFLSGCIARALLDSFHSVLYFSAGTLFNLFSASEPEERRRIQEDLSDADLLIIDDLGTELLNSFTNSIFFTVLNDRLNLGKSTVISTNLNLAQLSARYSERIASRIVSGFRQLHLTGEDLRVKLRLRALENS